MTSGFCRYKVYSPQGDLNTFIGALSVTVTWLTLLKVKIGPPDLIDEEEFRGVSTQTQDSNPSFCSVSSRTI